MHSAVPPYGLPDALSEAHVTLSVTNRRPTASDCPEGNRRDYSMSGNQTSGKEGGVQGVLMVVCMYVCMLDIVCV